MKGILFVEFIDFLDEHASEEATQEIINRANLESEGAYSRVGQYDYQELIALLVSAAGSLNVPANELLDGYTDHLMAMFARDYPDFFVNATCAGDILKELDSHIHVQVKKLYPEAELPKFDHHIVGKTLHLKYTSPRPLAAVAHSLTNSCIKHFGKGERLVEATIAEDQCSAEFVIEMAQA